MVVLDDWADPERKMTVKKGAVVFLKHSLGFQKDPPGDSIGFFDVSGILEWMAGLDPETSLQL